MNWLSSLFSSSSSSRPSRKAQAMSSTRDAFSLPTSSPGFQDVYGGGNSFDPESASSPAFTYPPQAGAYDYVPTTAGGSNSRSQHGSILPIHSSSPLSPLPPYPSVSRSWDRIRNWLADEYPELGDTLNYGILPETLAEIEMQFGFALPPAVRESYLSVDGQEAESAAGCAEGLFFGLSFLPLEDVLDEWRFWREVDDDPTTGTNPQLQELMQSIPSGWIRRAYSHRGWIPLVTDKTGNYLGVDLSPGENGAAGQVIVFGRDFDTKVVMWRGEGSGGWARWLSSFAEELESGESFETGGANDGSEGSEDSVGFEGYFFDGTGGNKGGGETGTEGLRLTGEYRGWNVLEAWADRSVRRWRESGVTIDSVTPTQEKMKPKGSDQLPITAAVGISGVEIPIPVLAEGEGSKPHDASSTTYPVRRTFTPVPTISVTKPPAPQPVDLPTPYDIDSPPDSPPGSPDSVRAAELPMREIDRQLPAPSAPQNSTSTSTIEVDSEPVDSSGWKEAALVPLPLSRNASPLGGVASPGVLVESVSELDSSVPVEPTSPATIRIPLKDLDPVPVDGKLALADGPGTTYESPSSS